VGRPHLIDTCLAETLVRAHDMKWEDIELEAGRKRAQRGGFDRRIFLEYVDQACLHRVARC
jgi:hypothetical protein